MLGFAIGLTILANTRAKLSVVQGTYKQKADEALAKKDFRTARLCYDRLLTLAQTPTGKNMAGYGLVQSLEGMRAEPNRVKYLITQIAPLDRPGYPEAQLWAAMRLLAAPNIDPKDLGDAELHLKRAVDGAGISTGPRAALGQLYALTGRLSEAVPLLRDSLKERPELRIVLASVYRQQGLEQAAVEEAEFARSYYERKVQADLSDKQSRYQLALVNMFAKNHAEAHKVIREGLAREPDAAEFQALFADNCALWVEQLAKEKPDALAEQLTLIEQGLRAAPGQGILLSRMQTILRRNDATSDEARALLVRLLADGNAPAAIHFILGADAFEHRRPDEARIHWEQAIKLSPTFTYVANNLAWIQSESEKPDLEAALGLVDLALKQQPQVPQFHGTRGHVLKKLGRHQEALEELEKALVGTNKESYEVHRDLAETYEALGLKDQAKVHRDKVYELELRAGLKPSKPTLTPANPK